MSDIDLTQIDQPFGELGRETKLALMAHWVDWGVVEIYSRGGWIRSKSPAWSATYRYRAAAPQQPMVVPWDAMNPRIKWAAADRNGVIYGFRGKPSSRDGMWWNSATFERLDLIVNIERGNLPWDQSLVCRPGHEQEGDE